MNACQHFIYRQKENTEAVSRSLLSIRSAIRTFSHRQISENTLQLAAEMLLELGK